MERPRVILLAATSLDGRITRGTAEGTAFTSPSDQAWFRSTLATMDAVLMGRKTFDAVRGPLIARRADARAPRHVFTRAPARFASLAGPGLRFTDESPENRLLTLAREGRRRVALVGGAELHAAFFAAGCVDEVWLTLEPWIFGAGKPLVAPGCPEIALAWQGTTQLSTDTLLLEYAVRRA
jgi:dihydrofolate reductase